MDEPADQETSSTLAMWDYIPHHTVGGRHEVADPAELEENPHIHQTVSTPSLHLRCINDTYHRALKITLPSKNIMRVQVNYLPY